MGEKNEESEGVLFPLLPRDGVERGGAPTVAGWRRRWSFGAAALGGQGGRCAVVGESWGWRARWRAYLYAGWSKEEGGERWPAGKLEGGRLMAVGAISASWSGVMVLR